MSIKNEIQQGLACDSVGHPHSIVGRAVCLSVHPGKMILFPFVRWFDKRYRHKQAFAKTLFAVDLVLIGIAATLGAIALYFFFFPPSSFEDNIHFEATVAPKEISTGASSTLVLRYTNGTEEELRDLVFSFSYPNHFLLEEVSSKDGEYVDNHVYIDSLGVGASGTVRIRGAMFGDVGGEQRFESTMQFVHGEERDIPVKKQDVYSFSPSRSTLALTLALPERITAFQNIEGRIDYHNTGKIDFPAISVEPVWPEGFVFDSTNATFTEGRMILPAIHAGDSGSFVFSGSLEDPGEDVTFVFHPSFTFGEDSYKQQTLTHSAPVIPPQISTHHSLDKNTLKPGSTLVATIEYEHTGEFPIHDVEVGIESVSPFFKQDVYTVGGDTHPELETLQPGDRGSVEIEIPIRSQIFQRETRVYENLTVSTRGIARYTLTDGVDQRVQSKGEPISTAITTPFILESFGRYATASGEQIGRGPLPPRIGKETTYWIFWHLGGTTSDIKDVVIEGILPPNVRFTGKQTASIGSGVSYDPASGTVRWSIHELSPTLSPTSKVVGVAFEVGITPSESQIGSTPSLMSSVQATATDTRTGVFLSDYGPAVSTNLPKDLIAKGKSIVE